tara:strand:+ start:824 stop:1180 length:357 start_codon:yes stop_codon:yes gene_type:complete
VLPDAVTDGAPDWAIGLIAGVFLVVYVANIYGKMPGRPVGGGSGGTTHCGRHMLAQVAKETKKLTDLLGHRDDDGMERFLLTAKHTKESRELLIEILKVQEAQERHLDKIAQHLARTA